MSSSETLRSCSCPYWSRRPLRRRRRTSRRRRSNNARQKKLSSKSGNTRLHRFATNYLRWFLIVNNKSKTQYFLNYFFLFFICGFNYRIEVKVCNPYYYYYSIFVIAF
ncbi:hypothetical protein AAZX31_05G061500 [Glycine max]